MGQRPHDIDELARMERICVELAEERGRPGVERAASYLIRSPKIVVGPTIQRDRVPL